MSSIRRFWTQASIHYRNFQLAYTGLLALFVAAATVALVAPGGLLAGVTTLDVWLGGAGWAPSGIAVDLTRAAGTIFFAASAGMVRWLQDDLRYRQSSLMPLVFLQAAAAIVLIGGYLGSMSHPVMLLGGIAELVVCGIALGFAGFARADLHGRPDALLVPRPVGKTPLGWSRREQRWIDAILAASLPADPESEQPGVGQVDLEAFWPHYIERVPLQFRLGLRLSTWLIGVWPLLTGRAFGTFLSLSEKDRDEVLSEIAESRFFLIRQIAFILKTTAGFAYFTDPQVQQNFPAAYAEREGLDERGPVEDSDEEQRRERPSPREVPLAERSSPSEILADGGTPGTVEESTTE